MKKSAESGSLRFDFQEIPLEEAQHISQAGRGRYAELCLQLMERLPKLAPDKAFAFGAGEDAPLSPKDCKGISMSLNATLKKSGIDWKVVYSPSKKLFVCCPRGQAKPWQNGGHVGPKQNEVTKKIVELRREGLPPRIIARQLGADAKTVYNASRRLSAADTELFEACGDKIKALRAEGLSLRKIADKLELSRGTVERIVNFIRRGDRT